MPPLTSQRHNTHFHVKLLERFRSSSPDTGRGGVLVCQPGYYSEGYCRVALVKGLLRPGPATIDTNIFYVGRFWSLTRSLSKEVSIKGVQRCSRLVLPEDA